MYHYIGDKDGNVGLWRVDQLSGESSAAEAAEEGDGSEDGVLYYRPHGGAMYKFNPLDPEA